MTIERPPKKPWSSLRVTLLAIATAFVSILGALLVYSVSAPESFGRLLAQFLLQVAVVVLGGAIIKFLMDENVKRRDKADREISDNMIAAEKKRSEAELAAQKARSEKAVGMRLDQAKRAEFLQRIRAKHVQISYAQTLIVAHDSGRTYTEQLRQLMLIGPELEDLAEDLKAARDLFEPVHATEIVEGVEGIVNFLGRGSSEYVRCHGRVDDDAKRGEKLSSSITQNKMDWVQGIIRSFPSMPQDYVSALSLSKGNLRRIVYASSGNPLSPSVLGEPTAENTVF